jgi:hypothetical protein
MPDDWTKALTAVAFVALLAWLLLLVRLESAGRLHSRRQRLFLAMPTLLLILAIAALAGRWS